jgi:hypothetical protein
VSFFLKGDLKGTTYVNEFLTPRRIWGKNGATRKAEIVRVNYVSLIVNMGNMARNYGSGLKKWVVIHVPFCAENGRPEEQKSEEVLVEICRPLSVPMPLPFP